MDYIDDEIWRVAKVMQTVGMKRSSFYAEVNEGRFPLPVKLGPRAVGWRKSDVMRWIAAAPTVRLTPVES